MDLKQIEVRLPARETSAALQTVQSRRGSSSYTSFNS